MIQKNWGRKLFSQNLYLLRSFSKFQQIEFMSLATDTCFHVSTNPLVQQDRYRLQKSRKKDNYSCYRTILLIIAFDLFKHISHKSRCQGMVWFDAD